MSEEERPIAYIAGPLFTEGDRWYLEQIDDRCAELGYSTYLPHRDAGLSPPSGEGTRFFFEADKDALVAADVVVAVLNGPDVDAGTAWEIGYAYARGTPIVGIVDDTRVADPRVNINLMIYHSVDVCTSVDELMEKLGRLVARGGAA